jgi:hypothetical protein
MQSDLMAQNLKQRSSGPFRGLFDIRIHLGVVNLQNLMPLMNSQAKRKCVTAVERKEIDERV